MTHRCIAVLLLATVGLAAQSRPDLSGHWKISQAKSSAGAAGNNATISFPSELVIDQQGGELRVEMRFPRSDVLKVSYLLDGTEVTIKLPSNVTVTARAVWDNDRVAITSRRVVSTFFGDFITDGKEAWSRTGDVLTIQKTESGDGVSETETAVFERN